jgi:hypothetical protein
MIASRWAVPETKSVCRATWVRIPYRWAGISLDEVGRWIEMQFVYLVVAIRRGSPRQIAADVLSSPAAPEASWLYH